MGLSRDEVEAVLSNNNFDNVICRALESRPGELAKYICALANKAGGYIIIGAEKENEILYLSYPHGKSPRTVRKRKMSCKCSAGDDRT